MNDSTSDLLLLLGGAGIILLVATAIGKMLAYRQAEGAPSAVIDLSLIHISEPTRPY